MGGFLKAKDKISPFETVVNNERYTANVPQNAKRHIYFLGNSVSYGLRVKDDETIESKLQEILNDKYEFSFIVIKYEKYEQTKIKLSNINKNKL
ncbi:hypothetical protein FACS1894132_11990 [Clostridia bacterium]|nr:hypothetical protein FACS1894132_11990 [Clostridia bacterium]